MAKNAENPGLESGVEGSQTGVKRPPHRAEESRKTVFSRDKMLAFGKKGWLSLLIRLGPPAMELAGFCFF